MIIETQPAKYDGVFLSFCAENKNVYLYKLILESDI